jgi:uncharacterized protein with ATP-grasp and redox domains
MCRVKNLTTTSLDFDSWFANLKVEGLEQKMPEIEGGINFEDLLAPLPMFDTTYAPETIEPIKAETFSHPSPAATYIPQQPFKRQMESEDPLARKKHRQNEAARRCRQKKLSLIQESQHMVKRFEEEKFEMSIQLAVLDKEKQAWEVREREMLQQLSCLKKQLDESHLILLNVKQI